MKNKMLYYGIAGMLVIMLVTLTGCGNNNEGSATETASSTKASENIKGKHNVFECIKLIEINNTVEEINEIIGFAGECTDEENKVYKWEISDDTSVRVQYSKYSKETSATIDISFPGKLIANDKVDFSKFNEIKSAMNTKEGITYEAIVEKLGGVEGTLKSKSDNTLRYEWDNSSGYLTCTISPTTGKCTFASGRF